ncbi:MAG: citramalate synthase [Candidatus Rokubacteria bacterium 13_1_40CM_4_69_5]|nr:MAG: citramalate synthase [Candidatus Rokubacteria bacterium 13_1_40CM_4_69_5]OLE36572.1 MAG: citramalate synthase [Candidatus Rokubacteria bacterium 13_1_20CM_2_70_7]
MIKIYDTTLRDGTQGEGVSFSMEDKVRLATRFDAFGIHYIEGGWPGSNPKDLRFFRRMQDVALKHAKLAAFSMTRRAGASADSDANMRALIEGGAPVATIVGKSWDFHVTHVLETTLPENLAMIADTIAFLRSRVEEVIYDAEHFFDGFRANRDYALATLRAAADGGAHWIVLCDTNGGTLPVELVEMIREVKRHIRTPLGIHAHNDAECAVANSLAAVMEGVGQVQGTMNGFGERCGNANLVSIVPSLVLKLGFDCIPAPNLGELRDLSRFAAELANRKPWSSQPYVGDSAFAHKGGMHVSAVLKHPETYEHVNPEAVGNHRRVLVSELAGKSNILWKAREYGIDIDRETPDSRRILDRLKALEDQGFQFEGAEASFELLMERALGRHTPYFELEAYRVIVEEQNASAEPVAEATVRLRVKGIPEHTAASGNGPVDALDHALRKALEEFYPKLKEMRLLDYKVRILDESKGTAAKTRVLITSGDGRETWGTVGVADNIIEASWQALVDSIEYKLRADERRSGAR